MPAHKLQHLVVEPCYGLCNRIRVIAAAKRFAAMNGVRCTLVWNWLPYESLFEPDPTIEIVSQFPALPDGHLRLRPRLDDRSAPHQRLPLDEAACIAITTCHSLGSPTDLHYLGMRELLPWLPQPAAAIREKARLFRERMFPAGQIVGLHIRRTDSERPILDSPNWRFFHQARAVVDSGARLYLATDNRRTESQMSARFADSLIMYPKNPAMRKRWPRPLNLAETIEDYADLLALASCDHVLGSRESSFSDLAMALNGSSRSTEIERLPIGRLTADERRQRMMDGFARLPIYLRRIRRVAEPGIGIGRWTRKIFRISRQ
ncbi:MAG TPA: hypothetical protein VGJ31_00085 [Dongiaceae bacterium]|jgi:hypothetical protein